MDTRIDPLFADPSWFLHKLDPVLGRALFVRLGRDQLRQAAFLDERILGNQSEGAWIPMAALPAMPVALGVHRFLFHVGHCGSTLLSRLLGQWPMAHCLREPLPLRTLADAQDMVGSPLARLSPLATEEARRSVLGLMGRTFEPGQQVIVKATSSCNALITPILADDADARVALVSLPLEPYLATVLKSGEARRDALDGLPARLAWLHRSLGKDVPRLHELAAAEAIAMGWLAEELRFAQLRGDGRVIRVDFEGFLAQPVSQLARIAAHFGLDDPERNAEKAWSTSASSRYAKATAHPYGSADRKHDLDLSRQRFAGEIQQGLEAVAHFRACHAMREASDSTSGDT